MVGVVNWDRLCSWWGICWGWSNILYNWDRLCSIWGWAQTKEMVSYW